MSTKWILGAAAHTHSHWEGLLSILDPNTTKRKRSFLGIIFKNLVENNPKSLILQPLSKECMNKIQKNLNFPALFDISGISNIDLESTSIVDFLYDI